MPAQHDTHEMNVIFVVNRCSKESRSRVIFFCQSPYATIFMLCVRYWHAFCVRVWMRKIASVAIEQLTLLSSSSSDFTFLVSVSFNLFPVIRSANIFYLYYFQHIQCVCSFAYISFKLLLFFLETTTLFGRYTNWKTIKNRICVSLFKLNAKTLNKTKMILVFDLLLLLLLLWRQFKIYFDVHTVSVRQFFFVNISKNTQ